MMQRIQALPKWGRIIVFSVFILLIVAFFGGLTVFVLISSARSTPRTEAIAILADELTVYKMRQSP